MSSDPSPSADDLQFGPGGYLPERASKRARKIVLRAPLGLQWIAAAVVAGVVVVIAGVLFLGSAGGPPGAPYVEVGPLADLTHGQVVTGPGADGLASLDAGRVRVFDLGLDAEVAWCEASRRFEASDGRVWSPTGRGLGTASLVERPSVVVNAVLYVDWTATLAGPAPSADAATPTC